MQIGLYLFEAPTLGSGDEGADEEEGDDANDGAAQEAQADADGILDE